MRPTWIINENVVGSVSNGVVLGKINDLESEGYRARPFIIPACSVGAMHQRERVFIVAYSTGPQRESRAKERRILSEMSRDESKFNNFSGPSKTCEIMAYSAGKGLQEWQQPTGQQDTAKTGAGVESEPERCCEDVAYASCAGFKECNFTKESNEQRYNPGCINERRCDRSIKPGMGGNVNGIPSGVYRPGGYQDSGRVFEAFEGIFTAVLEQIKWPAGYGAEQYDYESPRVAVGVKNRSKRLKALGNAIVWQQIFPILLAIKLIEGEL